MIKRLIGRIKTLRLYFVIYSIFKRNKSIVEHNKELGFWLLENKFSDDIREKIIYFVNESYEQGFRSGYSECMIVNFIDEEKG